MRMNCAGNPCVAWSSVGSKQNRAHMSERDFAIWLAERAARAEQGCENLFLQECTVLFPHVDKVTTPLEDTHHVVQAVVNQSPWFSQAKDQDHSLQVCPKARWCG